MITEEDIRRIKLGTNSAEEQKLEWHSEGISKPPITILGKNQKLMLMTLAILQSPINTFKCKITGKKIPKDY